MLWACLEVRILLIPCSKSELAGFAGELFYDVSGGGGAERLRSIVEASASVRIVMIVAGSSSSSSSAWVRATGLLLGMGRMK
jgi:hypothetical protein